MSENDFPICENLWGKIISVAIYDEFQISHSCSSVSRSCIYWDGVLVIKQGLRSTTDMKLVHSIQQQYQSTTAADAYVINKCWWSEPLSRLSTSQTRPYEKPWSQTHISTLTVVAYNFAPLILTLADHTFCLRISRGPQISCLLLLSWVIMLKGIITEVSLYIRSNLGSRDIIPSVMSEMQPVPSSSKLLIGRSRTFSGTLQKEARGCNVIKEIVILQTCFTTDFSILWHNKDSCA